MPIILNYYSRKPSRGATIIGVAVLLGALVAAVAALSEPENSEAMYQLYDEKRKMGHALTGLIKEIGRSEECDIAFPEDDGVSRLHARLDRDGEDWLLVDLGSTNGTFVNGERITEARLQPGDVIEMGDVVLRFLPLQVGDRPDRKKTTNVNIRRSEVDATRPDGDSKSRGLFSRVKTALKKRE